MSTASGAAGSGSTATMGGAQQQQQQPRKQSLVLSDNRTESGDWSETSWPSSRGGDFFDRRSASLSDDVVESAEPPAVVPRNGGGSQGPPPGLSLTGPRGGSVPVGASGVLGTPGGGGGVAGAVVAGAVLFPHGDAVLLPGLSSLPGFDDGASFLTQPFGLDDGSTQHDYHAGSAWLRHNTR